MLAYSKNAWLFAWQALFIKYGNYPPLEQPRKTQPLLNACLCGSSETLLQCTAYLESLALAMSPWPPNASLLFCQKEVLMLEKKQKTICYIYSDLLKSPTRSKSILKMDCFLYDFNRYNLFPKKRSLHTESKLILPDINYTV